MRTHVRRTSWLTTSSRHHTHVGPIWSNLPSPPEAHAPAAVWPGQALGDFEGGVGQRAQAGQVTKLEARLQGAHASLFARGACRLVCRERTSTCLQGAHSSLFARSARQLVGNRCMQEQAMRN